MNFTSLRTALSALLIASTALPAMAAAPVFEKLAITGDGIGVPTIHVVSDGSGKWTSVVNEKLSYQAHITIKMKKGEIVSLHANGKPINGMWDNVDGYYAGEYLDGPKSISKVITFKMSSSKLAIPALVAVSNCNALLDQGKDPYKKHTTYMSVPLGLAVTAQRGKSMLTRTADGEASATLVCEAMPKPTAKPKAPPAGGNGGTKPGAADLKVAPPPPVVQKVQLGIKTAGNKSCPQNANLTAWVFTDKPGNVSFVFRNADGGKSNPIKVKAVKGAGGVFMATYTQKVAITKTIDTKYMIESVANGKISNWVPLKVTCLTGGNGQIKKK